MKLKLKNWSGIHISHSSTKVSVKCEFLAVFLKKMNCFTSQRPKTRPPCQLLTVLDSCFPDSHFGIRDAMNAWTAAILAVARGMWALRTGFPPSLFRIAPQLSASSVYRLDLQ
ncbi:MAG: hypothetical protein H7Z16_02110 [Pyrinomonadaceae bacterium]|nr:hypothetical protein [Pyrinomonadaceae bacterium]